MGKRHTLEKLQAPHSNMKALYDIKFTIEIRILTILYNKVIN